MMNTSLPCPTCGRPTTPSSIGYVCVDCERVWPRDSVAAPHPTPHLATSTYLAPNAESISKRDGEIMPAPDTAYPKISPSYSIHRGVSEQAVDMEAGYEYSLKSRLKRLVIPELPSGLEESRSLEAPDAILLATSAAKQAVEAVAPPQEFAAAPQTSHTPDHTTPQHHDATAVAGLAAVMADKYPVVEPEAARQLTVAEVAPELAFQPTVASETEDSGQVGMPQEPSKQALQRNPAEKESEQDTIAETESQWVLLSTIGLIIVVISIGAWLTLRNRSAPVRVRTTPQPAASQPKQNVSAEVAKRDAQRKKDLHDITTALEVYKQQQGSYPAGQDIAVLYPLQYTTPPFISFVNYDPLSSESKKVKYAYTSDGSSFTIQARLENANDTEAQSGYYTLRSK